MFFFEHFGLNAKNDFRFYMDVDYAFPRHFHRAFECLHVFYGELAVQIDEDDRILTAGDTVLIFPNQLHAFQTENHAVFMIVIFSPDFALDFATVHAKELPDDNLLENANVSFYSPISSRLGQKAWIYQLLAQFEAQHHYHLKYVGSQALLYRVLDYIESNYTHKCSLRSAADALGYEYSYLSHSFSHHFGMTYTHYLQQLRLLHALELLQTTTAPIYIIAEQTGFQSLHHFNQVFRQELHTTPSAMRKEWHDPQNQLDTGQVPLQG